jgi:hypothetical protein
MTGGFSSNGCDKETRIMDKSIGEKDDDESTRTPFRSI